jgi:hypothetical protein
MRTGVQPEDLYVASGRRDEAEDEGDAGCLAGAVRAEKPIDAPPSDLEVKLGERQTTPVPFCQLNGSQDDIRVRSQH